MLNAIRIRETLQIILQNEGYSDRQFIRNVQYILNGDVDLVNISYQILKEITDGIVLRNQTLLEILPGLSAISPMNDEIISEIKSLPELSNDEIYNTKSIISEIAANKNINSVIKQISKSSNEILNGKINSPSALKTEFNKLTELMFETNMKLEKNSNKDDIEVSAETADDIIDRIEEYIEHNKIVIPTGLELLDRALDGGLHSSRLYTLAIKSGGGKSTVMLSLAQKIQEMLDKDSEIFQKILRTKSEGVNKPKLVVYYYTFENSIDESLERYYPALIKKKATNMSEFKVFKEELKSKLESYDVVLSMVYRSSFSTSPLQIIQDIERDKIKGNIPVAVFSDYLGLMISSDDTQEKRLQLEKITAGLKDVSVYFNCPVFTGVQIKKDSYNKEEVDESDIKEASGIIDNSDVIIGAWQGQNIDVDGSIKQMVFKIAKQRNFRSNIKFAVGVNFNIYSLFNLEYSQSKIESTGTMINNDSNNMNHGNSAQNYQGVQNNQNVSYSRNLNNKAPSGLL